MKTFAFVAVAAAALSAPAFASDQLAAQLDLDAGNYTLTELIEIKSAIESEDRTRADFYINERSSVVSTQSVGVTAGQAQLAAQLGVDPANYSTAELARLVTIQNQDDS